LPGGLHSFREIAALKENPVAAALALNSNIRSQPYHFPLPASTRMRFPQLHNITHGKIRQHAFIITTPDGG
jgi:hypothetical protein